MWHSFEFRRGIIFKNGKSSVSLYNLKCCKKEEKEEAYKVQTTRVTIKSIKAKSNNIQLAMALAGAMALVMAIKAGIRVNSMQLEELKKGRTYS